jgi:hypothetical protein
MPTAGRPPKPTKVAPVMMDAAEAAVAAASRRIASKPGARPARLDPRVADAVLAIHLAEALEVFAAREIREARERDCITWADIGTAFSTTAQSAHARFRSR